jgi:hypothetical protein
MKQQLRKRGALLLVGHLLDPCDQSIDPAAVNVSETEPRLLPAPASRQRQTMLSDVGFVLAGLLAVAIILMASRYLLDPHAGRRRVRNPRRRRRGCARPRMACRESRA